MSTSVQGRVVRPRLGYDSFTHITAVPVAQGGITSAGILFDGVLTVDEVAAVWRFITSRDGADQSARDTLTTLRNSLATTTSPANRDALLIALTDYLLDL